MPLILLLIIALLTGCTSMVPCSRLPFPLTDGEPDHASKVVTVPLPVIAASPNEGVALGALAAFLLHDQKNEVSTLVAPQINYNENFGTTASIYGAFYPEPGRFWEFNLSKSTHVNKDYELRYQDRNLNGGTLELNAFLFALSDGSARFFGFGSASTVAEETNFADSETGVNLSLGYTIAHNLQLVAGERYKQVSIQRGAVVRVHNIHDRFNPAKVPGLNGFTAHAQRIALVYSSLDSPAQPTEGLYATVSAEGSFMDLGSSATYQHYNLELKGLLPLADKRFITVGRLASNQARGNDVPFLERSILGGENTLRGFGRNRFVDSSSLVVNLEERIRLFRWEIFDVLADWELVPFLDVGGVAASLDRLKRSDFTVNPGIGFRAVVRPNIVGRVDMGWGSEGLAIFVGLGYPF